MSFFDERLLPMQAYAGEIGGEIAPSPDTAHRAQFFGIVSTRQVQGSANSAAMHLASARAVHPTHRRLAHTDPQILFSVATS